MSTEELAPEDSISAMGATARGSTVVARRESLRRCEGMVLLEVNNVAVRNPVEVATATEGCPRLELRFRPADVGSDGSSLSVSADPAEGRRLARAESGPLVSCAGDCASDSALASGLTVGLDGRVVSVVSVNIRAYQEHGFNASREPARLRRGI